MRRTLGVLAVLVVVVALAGCASDSPQRADDPDPSDNPFGEVLLAGLTVATMAEPPCVEAKRSTLDEAVASGGVWMPSVEPALIDDLEHVWSCGDGRWALDWPELTIMFLPEAPKRPRAYFEKAADQLDGRVEPVLGVPAFVLGGGGVLPDEVEIVMGDTLIVLFGNEHLTTDELVTVANSMAPLH
jgi:hypothetical protein